MEGFNSIANSNQKEKTPKRLMVGLEALIKLQIGNVKIEGAEHIKEIPIDRKKIIVVSSHLTDLDMPLVASAVGNDFNIKMVNMSVHHSFSQEASTAFGVYAAGKDNFIPVDYTKEKTGDKTVDPFNVENFEPMIKALDEGKQILIAGHNPSHDGKFHKPGLGAAYLALLTDAVILPVGVKIESKGDIGMYGSGVKTFLKKPDADIKIGLPFELSKIDGIEEFKNILEKRKRNEQLTNEERKRFKELSLLLREKADEILKKLIELVPDKK